LNGNISQPDSAKKYIINRIKEIALFETDGTPLEGNELYYCGIPKYFPLKLDLKKLFLARDTIGKIDTYRLYRDYIKDSYDQIEIDYYLAVIIHEPRLVDSVSHLLPHLKIRLLNSIKNGLGLNEYTTNLELTLIWEKVQLIRVLYLLNEDILYVFNSLKIIVLNIAKDDIDSMNFLVYVFWGKLINNIEIEKYINLIFGLLNELPENSPIRKIWGQFKIWILNHQRFTYRAGYSFKYLKDFYSKKEVEYPNHLTTGYEFLSLSRKIRGLIQLVESASLKCIPEDKISSLKDLFQLATSKIGDPFLKIIDNDEFKEIIEFCGYKDRFYGDSTSAIALIKEVQTLFDSSISIESLRNIVISINKFSGMYLNSNSDFGKFFFKYEISILDIY